MREPFKVTGIVLSVYPIGENDRRLTILTKERGKVQVFARGCRKPNHPLFGVSQPLVFGEFMIVEGRSFTYLNSAEGKEYFPWLKKELDSIYYSTYFAELAEYFTVEGMDERNILNLLFVTFQAMKKKLVPFSLIRRIYEYKILQFYGISLECFRCLSCGKEEELVTLSVENGGMYCRDCGSQIHGNPVEPAVLYTLQFVSAAPLSRLYTFTLKESVFLEFQWIVKQFFRIHAEHRFLSAEMLDEL